MIVPLINNMPGFGFAEVARHGDGRVQRVGVIQFTPANARRVQALLHRGASLVYSGPVWVHDHWSVATFPVVPSDSNGAPELSTTLEFSERV